MIEVNPWLFILLTASAMGAYVGGFLYGAHWWLHRRPQKPSPVPPPPSRIIRP